MNPSHRCLLSNELRASLGSRKGLNISDVDRHSKIYLVTPLYKLVSLIKHQLLPRPQSSTHWRHWFEWIHRHDARRTHHTQFTPQVGATTAIRSLCQAGLFCTIAKHIHELHAFSEYPWPSPRHPSYGLHGACSCSGSFGQSSLWPEMPMEPTTGDVAEILLQFKSILQMIPKRSGKLKPLE